MINLIKSIEKIALVLIIFATVIAIGYEKPNLFFDDQYSIETSSDGTIRANDKNYLTSRKKFFSCGDSRRGQSLVVWAIKEGRDCAHSVHKFLKKKTINTK